MGTFASVEVLLNRSGRIKGKTGLPVLSGTRTDDMPEFVSVHVIMVFINDPWGR
jgi:hypothetical protein